MLHTLAVGNYRSINNLVMPLGRLNLITGANGSGKSNLYRALRLLAETARGGVINALARDGGLESTIWAGPEKISRRMQSGEVPVQGGPRSDVVRLRLGFAGEDFGYAISLGLPTPSHSAFALDPEIKRECIWAGPCYRPAALLVDREGPMVRQREGRSWQVLAQHLPSYDSLFDQIGNDPGCPEVFQLRETIRRWRFYDHFRTDAEAPARQPQLGTRTPVAMAAPSSAARCTHRSRKGKSCSTPLATWAAWAWAKLSRKTSTTSRGRRSSSTPSARASRAAARAEGWARSRLARRISPSGLAGQVAIRQRA